MRSLAVAVSLAVLLGCGPTPVTNVTGLAPVATSGSYEDLEDAPALSAVATSGAYADLSGAPELASVASSGSYADLAGLPDFSPVAISGAYSDLVGVPALSPVATSGSYLALSDTPAFSAVALSGDYGDLTGRPVFATVAASGNYSDLVGAPALSPVALTGSYADLGGRPALSAVAISGSYADLGGTPNLAGVATSGSYADLSGAPSLSTVATSGSYADLSGAPALSTVATSGSYADLTGAPALSTVATSGSYADLTGAPALSSAAISGSYTDLTNQPWSLDPLGLSTSRTVSVGAPASAAPLSVSLPGLGAPVTDQESSAGGVIYGPNTFAWQSFTAGVSSQLTQVSVFLGQAVSGTFTLNIYRGQGTAGALLYSGSSYVLTASQFTAMNLTAPLQIWKGEQYTWELVNSEAFSLIGYSWATYPGGIADYPPQPGQSIDYRFRTATTTEPVRLQVASSGAVGVGIATPSAALDVEGAVRFRTPRSPASNAPCQSGELAWDGDYVYVCVATNSWRRSALSAY